MKDKVLLRMDGISKRYGANQVLKDINLHLHEGEIHSLVGENGAGKSTLMNILFGMEVIHSTGGYEGTLSWYDDVISIDSPQKAMTYGIGMVHQEFMLIPKFTITENVKLNREITHVNPLSYIFGKRLNHLNDNKMNNETKQALDYLEMDISERTIIEGLPVGYKQFIEIAREIDKTNLKLLVFDEPTAVLTESEAASLLKTVKKLSQQGIAILFISHRLEEVMDISDRITILRDGELITCTDVKDTSVDELAELMVGRKISLSTQNENKSIGSPLLTLKDYCVDMPGEEVKGINLEITKGEILGLAGLAGQGKLGISNGIMGLYPSQGELIFKNESIRELGTKQILKEGISFVSEDRKGVGLLLDQSIMFNIAFTDLTINNHFLANLGFTKLIKGKAVKQHAEKMIKDLDIRCVSALQSVGRLSGGNQQKVCLARAITMKPEILMVSEPTRGIDVGAKKLILDLLIKLNKEYGMTIVITSSELAELRAVAHRIAIISEGQVSGILSPSEPDREFGLLMASRKAIHEKEGA